MLNQFVSIFSISHDLYGHNALFEHLRVQVPLAVWAEHFFPDRAIGMGKEILADYIYNDK